MFRPPEWDSENLEFGGAAERCEILQDLSRASRQQIELRRHQIGDAVRKALCTNAGDVPAPDTGMWIIGKQAFVIQRPDELRGKERVAAGLGMNQVSQRPSSGAPALQRLGNQ